MYDRKTWIVVAACAVLLILNVFYMQKSASELRARQAIENAQKAAETPSADASPEALKKAAGEGQTPAVEPVAPKEEKVVTFETPEAIYTLTSAGGGVRTIQIKGQSGVLGPVLLNRHSSTPVGALAADSDTFEDTSYEYVQAESVEGKKAVFRGKLESGLIVTKTWSMVESGTGSGFQLDFALELKNPTGKSVPLEKYSMFLGSSAPEGSNEREGAQLIYHDGGGLKSVATSSFASGFFGMKKAKTIDTETVEKLSYAGVTDQFFATVIHPLESYTSLVWAKTGDVQLGEKSFKSIRAGMSLPKVEIPNGESRSFSYRVFTGKKENRILQKMENEQNVQWGAIMNYGMWSPFSRFMNRSLLFVHGGIEGFTGKASWGIAVILLTIIIRVAIWPLYNRSNRTAKRMSKLKPEMDQLREKYPDDPTKVSQETMALYRKYGINPLGSCLPMFAQLPIFMGFFAMLNHAVEMRGNGFLWIHDLAEPDTFGHIAGIPINILPILMGITSMIQMAMMPNTGGDKTQMAMMKLMPLMFLYICYSSPAALALYWTTSNLFSILQTWLSNRLPEPELKMAKNAAGKGWMQRMAEQAEAQQKMKKANGRVVEDEGPSKKRPPRTGG